MRMSGCQQALANGCSAGALAPIPVARVSIHPAVKLQSWSGQSPGLETKPPFQWVTGRSAFSDPRHVDSGRRGDRL